MIEATDGVAEVQVPPVKDEDSVGVDPMQMEVVPNKFPVEGGGVNVTVVSAVAFAQPPVPVTEYEIMVVPADIPVTKPVAALTVATDCDPEDQIPPVTVEESVEVPFEQIAVVPESVPAEGGAVTVIVAVAVTVEQPPIPVTV